MTALTIYLPLDSAAVAMGADDLADALQVTSIFDGLCKKKHHKKRCN